MHLRSSRNQKDLMLTDEEDPSSGESDSHSALGYDKQPSRTTRTSKLKTLAKVKKLQTKNKLASKVTKSASRSKKYKREEKRKSGKGKQREIQTWQAIKKGKEPTQEEGQPQHPAIILDAFAPTYSWPLNGYPYDDNKFYAAIGHDEPSHLALSDASSVAFSAASSPSSAESSSPSQSGGGSGGRAFFPRAAKAPSERKINGFTKLETRFMILCRVGFGMTNQEIAERMSEKFNRKKAWIGGQIERRVRRARRGESDMMGYWMALQNAKERNGEPEGLEEEIFEEAKAWAEEEMYRLSN